MAGLFLALFQAMSGVCLRVETTLSAELARLHEYGICSCKMCCTVGFQSLNPAAAWKMISRSITTPAGVLRRAILWASIVAVVSQQHAKICRFGRRISRHMVYSDGVKVNLPHETHTSLSELQNSLWGSSQGGGDGKGHRQD
jgi:hypothetical protein